MTAADGSCLHPLTTSGWAVDQVVVEPLTTTVSPG
jgi:hypothetical protein